MRLVFLVLMIVAGPVVGDVTPFQTPSGNIECYVGTGDGYLPSDIGCTIFERAGPPALPRPNNCKGAWGHHFSMTSRGKVEMECGDPGEKNTAPGVDKATYGQTGDFQGINCQSSTKGLECKNKDEHGFFLSRKRQSVF